MAASLEPLAPPPAPGGGAPSNAVPPPAPLSRLASELGFLAALWRANLLAAMEYRASFVAQVLGMMLNNAVYFLFWVIFFGQFEEVRGWGLEDMFLLFGVVATGFGLGVLLFGNVLHISRVITSGRLDYYLALPRPVLLHVLASRTVPSGLGDLTYGVLTVVLAGGLSGAALGRFAVGALVAMTVFVGFLVLVQALAFWLGNAELLSGQAINAIILLATYPITLFDGSAKFILFTIVPAAFVGAVPASFVRDAGLSDLFLMLGAAAGVLGAGAFLFHRGLRRYESGSAIAAAV